MRKTSVLLALALVTGALLVPQAGVANTSCIERTMLADTFDDENAGTSQDNYSDFANWDVVSGTVDLMEQGQHGITMPQGGMFLDMDGTSGEAGTLRSKNAFTLYPGTYTLSFDLGGSAVSASPFDDLWVDFGPLQEMFTSWYDDAATTIVREFTVTTKQAAFLSFAGDGSDNIGQKLDNIWLTRCARATNTQAYGIVWTAPNPTLKARLTDAATNAPIEGETVELWANSGMVCTAVTNANGEASCGDLNGIITASFSFGFWGAVYRGNDHYLESNGSAWIV